MNENIKINEFNINIYSECERIFSLYYKDVFNKIPYETLENALTKLKEELENKNADLIAVFISIDPLHLYTHLLNFVNIIFHSKENERYALRNIVRLSDFLSDIKSHYQFYNDMNITTFKRVIREELEELKNEED